MEPTKGANERCIEWKEGTGMNADLEWGQFALVREVRQPSAHRADRAE